MTTWRYSISWSKLDLALKCQRALQFACEKTPAPGIPVTYWMDAGKLVQKTFELYFNQGLNLRPGGQKPETLQKAADRILSSPYRKNLNTVYPWEKNEADLDQQVKDQVAKGLETFRRMGMLDLKVQAEVMVNATFRGFRIFALIDFLRYGKSGAFIFDGKGHREENADPNQVRYYALALAALDRKIAGGGFVYWDHGFRSIDLSPSAIREFIDNTLDPVRPIFEKLKKGTDDLPPDPSLEKCKKCTWKATCDASMYKKEDVKNPSMDEVDLGPTGV